MDEYPQQPSDVMSSLTIEAETAVWQTRIDGSSRQRFEQVHSDAINALNKRLAIPGDRLTEMMVYCWGRGHFITSNGGATEYHENDDPTIYAGYSHGVQLAEIPASDDLDVDYRLVHVVALIAPYSIKNWTGHEIIATANLPIDTENFRNLDELTAIFETTKSSPENHSEEVNFLAQELSNNRNRPAIHDYRTHAEQAREYERLKALVETKIGNPGCGLILQSDTAYVVDGNDDGSLILRPATDLRGRPTEVNYLGVGDFASFSQSSLTGHQKYFDYDLHDGLFMAVTMSQQATESAGLLHQALLIPLAGNFFDYTSV